MIESGLADCSVSVTLDGTLGQGGGVSFRFSDASNGYFVDSDGTGATLYKLQAGAISGISSGFTSFAVGDVMTAEMTGSSIVILKNGRTVASTTQSFNNTATKHGLRDYTGVVRFRDFAINEWWVGAPDGNQGIKLDEVAYYGAALSAARIAAHYAAA